MFKRGTGSVFRRLFLMLLALVVIVYMVIMALFLNYVSSQRRLQEDRVAGQVNGSASVIGQQLDAARQVMNQLFSDTRLARLSQGNYPDNYERSELALDILASIQSSRDLNGLISDIVISFPSEQMELSAARTYHRRTYAPADFSQPEKLDGPLWLVDGHLELRLASPLRMSLEEDYIPDFEIRVLLSPDYLNSYLDSLRGSREEGAFWVLHTGSGDVLPFSDTVLEQELLLAWSGRKPGPGPHSGKLPQGDEYILTSTQVEGYNMSLVSYRSRAIQGWVLGVEIFYIGIVILVMGALFGMIVLWANRSVSRPLRKIMDSFQAVQGGDLTVRIFHRKNDEFDYIYDGFNATVAKIQELIESLKEQQSLLDRAEVMQLQSQINPHFLYNSFYNIKFLAHNEEYEQIETLVTALAKYYRFLNKQTSLSIPLSEEAAHMENYVEIQQMRFGDKISVEIQPVPPLAASFKVPKLILQPVVENAYGYGLTTLLQGGLLRVRYEIHGDMLYILISDNGTGLTLADVQRLRKQISTFNGESVNHALTNINRRLMLAYGEGCGLQLRLGEDGGLEVTMVLNLTVDI